MSFIIREAESSSENPHYLTLEGWEPDCQKALQIPTLAESTEVRDGFYHEDDWDGETRYEIVDLDKSAMAVIAPLESGPVRKPLLDF